MIVKVDVFCGSQMRKARIVNNMTLDDLVDKTQMEKKKLWLYEKGVKAPTKEEEKVIAEALDVLPDFFYLVDTCPLVESDCTFSARMRRL